MTEQEKTSAVVEETRGRPWTPRHNLSQQKKKE